MKIRMRTLASGPAGNYLAGHEYTSPHDLSEEQARSFVDGGYAEEVTQKAMLPDQIETADAPTEPIEMAVQTAPKSKRLRRKPGDEESEE
jgi:hypothetical protein